MIKYTYSVYVEGGLHASELTYKQAEKLRKEFESEGWSVRIVKFCKTIIGELGVDV